MFCEPLTPREFQILDFVAEGLTNTKIAKKLSISRRTVEHHNASIYQKLSTPNRTIAMAFYLKHKRSIRVRNRNYKNQRDR